MPAQLVALTDGPSILLDKPILLLGRHPECDIQIESRKISRRHCCIAQVNDYLVVRDLGSTNGIRINGVRVVEGCIKAGDELTIGSHRYQVHWDSLAAVATPGKGKGKSTDVSEPPPEAAEDDPLEAYDEPVPLPEPESASRNVPARPGLPYGPPGNVAPAAEDPEPPPSPLDSPSPLILPEHLELAPPSDVFPAAPSSHSHHPS